MSDPASRSEFLVISRGQWDADAAPADIQIAIDQFYEWLERLVAEGRMRPGQRLKPETRLVTRTGVLTDGPFIETKEVIGGFWFIQATSLEEAADLAAQNPCLNYGLSYEIRPIEPERADAFAPSTERPGREGD
ncbi:MAG TPA: YciI family protein [Chthoniobacterales bacterium]|jgi:hypothetical protein